MPDPHNITGLGPRPRIVTCIGCGKFGVILCQHCKEFNDGILRLMGKARSTIEQRFALRERP